MSGKIEHKKEFVIHVGVLSDDKALCIDVVPADGGKLCCTSCALLKIKDFLQEIAQKRPSTLTDDQLH